jgi:hypothetical protein
VVPALPAPTDGDYHRTSIGILTKSLEDVQSSSLVRPQARGGHWLKISPSADFRLLYADGGADDPIMGRRSSVVPNSQGD